MRKLKRKKETKNENNIFYNFIQEERAAVALNNFLWDMEKVLTHTK